MKKWLVLNDQDSNTTFEVEGNTTEEAAFEALNKLGWWIAENKEDSRED
jgi:hypothetical protein